MKINPDEYIVIDKKTLYKLFDEVHLSDMFDEWVENNEVPLMTLPQIQKDIVENSRRWWPKLHGDQLDLTATVLGICGEAGEVADELKKYGRGSTSQEQMVLNMANETIDLFHYICMIWVALSIDPVEVYKLKTEFNESRFGGS